MNILNICFSKGIIIDITALTSAKEVEFNSEYTLIQYINKCKRKTHSAKHKSEQ